MIKGLIILLSVEQEFDYIAYTCEMNCCMTWSVSKVQQGDKLDGIQHCIELKAKIMYCCELIEKGKLWK
jgi:hypothetical protein